MLNLWGKNPVPSCDQQNATAHAVTTSGGEGDNCNAATDDGQLHSTEKTVQGDLSAQLGVEIETRGQVKVEKTEFQDVVIQSNIGQFQCVDGANVQGGNCTANFAAKQRYEAPVNMQVTGKLIVDMSAVAEMIAKAAVMNPNFTTADDCPVETNPQPNPQPPPNL